MSSTDAEPVDPHPVGELAELARALRCELRRAERRGHRRMLVAAPRAADPATRPQVAAAPVAAAPVAAAPAPAALRSHTLQPEPRPPRAAPGEEAAGRAGGAAPCQPATGGETAAGAELAALRARAAGSSDLAALSEAVAACTACGLASTRTQTVFGAGSGRRRVMFVGEAPGADEDRQGLPFVGRAGQLLTDIITKGMGLSREDVYIANVLKCRPPGNRDPQPQEKSLCTGWLERQIELVDPLVLIPLGAHAACHLLGVEAPIGRLRGRVHSRGGRKIVPTYHPAYLLRSPGQKKECWQDIQLAMAELGLPAPT